MNLFQDIAFCFSIVAFPVACVLFGVLLRQYRLASTASDEVEPVLAELPRVVPVTAAPVSEPGPLLSSAAKPEPSLAATVKLEAPVPLKPEPGVSRPQFGPLQTGEPKPASLQSQLAALPSSAPVQPKPKSEITLSGSSSPALSYLQSVKSQLDMLEKEVAFLKGLASKQSSQEELILKKLGDLSEQLKAVRSAPIARPVQPAAPAARPAVALSPGVTPPPRPVQPVRRPAVQAPAPSPVILPPAPMVPATPPVLVEPTLPSLAPVSEPAPAEAPSAPIPAPAETLPATFELPQAPAQAEAPPAPVEAAPVPAPSEAASSPAAAEPVSLPPPAPSPVDPAPAGSIPAITLEGIPQQQADDSAENKPIRKGPVWPV